MKFMRSHWFDLGAALAVITGAWLAMNYHRLSQYQVLMWWSLISLLLHQLEEYRIVGTFPGMINTVLYRSPQPDRYPLNTQTSLIVNVVIGWTLYLLAALFAERAVWLGMAAMLVSAGNVIAHVFLFNIRGRAFFNAGMLTAVLLFLPLVIWFFILVPQEGLAGPVDYVAGAIAGVVLNVVGILKMIGWMADPDSPYIFAQRQMLRGGSGTARLSELRGRRH